MRQIIPVIAVVCVMAFTRFGWGEEAATQPSATTAVIRGHVSITGDLGLQKPDLTRVVVYLAPAPALNAVAGPTTRATVAQVNKAFVPEFSVVPCGTDVEFPNWDHISHNVFSFSAAAPAFDLDRYPYGQSKTRKFEKVGVVQLFCNIHPQMKAVIYVTPNRFFARPDAQGRFEIRGLPAGHFQVVAWNELCEEQRQPVAANAGVATQVDLTLTESHDRAATSTDVDRPADYGVTRGLSVKHQRLNLPVVADTHPAPEDSRPLTAAAQP